MKLIKTILLAFLLLGIGVPSPAQNVVNRMLGTDFWMMFLRQYEMSVEAGMAVDCFFVLTATEESDVTISYSATGWDTLVTVPAGGAVRVSVPDDQSPTHHFGAKIDSNAWHIQATTPISVTAYNDIDHSYDATAILPTDALRTYHITQVYQAFPHGPEVGIVAPYDSTRIWSVLEKNICSDTGFLDRVIFSAGDTIEFLLMRGQTCLLRNAGWTATQVTWISECSLNGLRLHSDKPIAVFQGNNGAYVPYGGDSQAPDHLYDQCIPVEYWGDHFVIEPVIGRQPYSMGYPPRTYHNYGDIVRVMAKDDNCHISLDGQEVAVLQPGQIYQFVLSDHSANLPSSWGMDFYHSPCIELTSTSPVMVCYYITGSLFGGHPGDPAVMTMPPIENGVNHAIFQPHNTPISTQHWINIVTHSVYASQITLDGANIGSQFSITAGGYSYACIPVSQATHTIDAGNGRFIAYLYGLGYCESYLHTVASTTENKPYNVWTQRNEACAGDSITVGIIMFDNSLSASWYIDGVWVADATDSLTVVFNSTGTHQIMTVISPIGDTVYTYITIVNYYSVHSTATICSGGSYSWRGLELSAGGNYADTLSGAGGCDSILVLHLNVTPPPKYTLFDTLCKGGTYTWRGRTLNEEGEYTDTVSAANGCDSILALNLSMRPFPEVTIYDTFCTGTAYHWYNRSITAEGTYIDTVGGPDGCDSIVKLELASLITPQITLDVDEDCNSKKYTIIAAVEPDDGITPYWSSLPADSTLDGQQWDSIVVSPTATIIYTLAFEGRCPNDTSIVLTPSEWPVAAMEVHPPMLDLDNLQLVAQDVSLNATERTWYVDDALA
ncbi:MAG: IgGFc-binding protein, partial [Bacteroidales bacterium]|nr:IgGFc-binding protein [Bacteroidales bacterium]